MTGALEWKHTLPVVVALVLPSGAMRAQTGAARAQTKTADLVLRNGVVHTLDARWPKAQAVAIAGKRIVAVGSDAEVGRLAGQKTRVIDLAGATVIPGFKESHGHLLGMGFARMSVDVTGIPTYAES